MTTDNNLPALLAEFEEDYKDWCLDQRDALNALSASIALNQKLVEALKYQRDDAWQECFDGRFEYRGLPEHGIDQALELAKQHGVE